MKYYLAKVDEEFNAEEFWTNEYARELFEDNSEIILTEDDKAVIENILGFYSDIAHAPTAIIFEEMEIIYAIENGNNQEIFERLLDPNETQTEILKLGGTIAEEDYEAWFYTEDEAWEYLEKMN